MNIRSLVNKKNINIFAIYEVKDFFEIDGEVSIKTDSGIEYLKVGQFELIENENE